MDSKVYKLQSSNKNMKQPKIRKIPDSKLFIQILDGEFVDRIGEKHIKSHWEEAIDDVDLGSIMKPNKRILGWRYDVPVAEKDNIFKNFFKG